jgi:NADPH-dependent curcumin reductase CurA
VMGGWLASGKLKAREDVVDGIDAFPRAFDMLFSGANNGKLVLKVA